MSAPNFREPDGYDRLADLQRDEVVLEREPREVGVVPEPELLEHVAAVGVDGLDADAEADRDLAIGEAVGEEADGLQLARAEHADWAAAAQRDELRAGNCRRIAALHGGLLFLSPMW